MSFPEGRHDDQVDCLSYAVEVHNSGSWSFLEEEKRAPAESRRGPMHEIVPADAFDSRGSLKSVDEMFRDMRVGRG